MNNWTLVSERLPEENKDVLITFLGYHDKQPRCGIAYIKNGDWLWSSDASRVIVEIVAWQYIEPCKIIKLTDDERKLLEVAYNQGYRWITRDKAYCLFIFKKTPYKGVITWDNYRECGLEVFGDMFEFIKWEDEEPYSIEELLKGEN